MNLACADQIAKAVLYEGYMLYPYRPSSIKNRQRFNFGVLYPQRGDAVQAGEPSTMHIECLVSSSASGPASALLEVRLRFLHLRTHTKQPSSATPASSLPSGWQEAVEREIAVPKRPMEEFINQGLTCSFTFPSNAELDPPDDSNASATRVVVRHQEEIHGQLSMRAEIIGEDLARVHVSVQNSSRLDLPGPTTHADILAHSLVSTHVILGVEDGEFVSLLEPPKHLEQFVAQCQNVGAWPVLVGEPDQRDTLLASPIILYDYPQIAPESAGDLFDATEIDEILSLRILTLTDEEKREIRQSDDRAREILERIETMPAEHFMKLHGAVRSLRPLEGDKP